MKKTRKLLSLILALVMLCSTIPGTAFAFTNGDAGAFTVADATVELDGTSDGEVTVSFASTSNDTYVMLEGNFSLTDDSGKITLASMTPAYAAGTNDNYVNNNTGKFAYFDGDLIGIEFAENSPIVTATYTVPADTVPGEYKISIREVNAMDVDGNELSEASYTATITVTEPAARAADYEIYYTLDSADDEDSDNYKDYDIGDQVTAEIFLVSNNADVTLQAYDIYLTYSDKLSYNSERMDGIAYQDNAEVGTAAESGDIVTHIQLVKDTTTIGLKQGEATSLGTIVFDIDDSVAYGDQLPITLTIGTETKDVTNFAIASDETSYYPVDISEVNGAEVLTTYDVTYVDGVDDEVIAVPNAQTKQHNVDLTLSSEEPSREGWIFDGWLDDDDNTYTAGDTYEGNADLTLTAQWKKNTVKVTWMNGDTELKQDDVNYGTTPSYTGEKPTKVADDQYTYTFVGWTTVLNGTTAEELTAVTTDTTYYAVFSTTTNEYNVIFNANGHGTAPKTQSIAYNSTASEPTAPAETGYTFGGWYMEADCNNAYDFSTPVTAEITLYAKWAANDVTVTLNANGGKIDDADSKDITETYDSKYTNLTDPTREGYTFDGWYTKQTGGEKVTAETSVTNASDHELYAHWSAITYTVKFDVNGASSGTAPESITATYGQAITMPAQGDLAKTDYEFAGWAKSSTATEADFTANQSVNVNLSTTQDDEVTLYAVWVRDVYTISYTHDPSNVSVTSTLPATYSSATGLSISDPEATGYTFVGWTSNALGITVAQKNVSILANTEGEVDLTAHWTINQYTITFETDGGSEIASITQDYGTAVTAPSDPTKTGYTFAGWDKEIPSTMPAEDLAITAHWTINQYTITFADTGDTTINPITQDYGTDVTAPSDPTKTGYTFNGWDKTIPTTMPGENVTITAQWTEHTYDIIFDKTDNSVSYDEAVTNKTDVKYSEEVTLPKTDEVTKLGYTLEGWTTDESGETAEYQPGTTVSKLTPEDDGSVTLYPVWKNAVYKLSFDLGEHPATDVVVPEAIDVTYNGTYNNLPTVNAADGYEFVGWYVNVADENTKIENGNTVAITADTTVTAKYRTIEYTITFALDGGMLPEGVGSTMTYTIESTDTLPAATRENYTFAGWKVTVADGNWAIDSVINADTEITGKYGNVTLTAQWNRVATPVVEQYKYAYDGYWMLRVDASNVAEGQEYQFNDESMYYTIDPNYLVDADDSGVFYTLIPEKYVDTANNALTDEGYNLLKIAACNARSTIKYDGDINGDDVVNIADANTVYQMTEYGGSYYNDGQLDIEARLKADMDTTINTGTEEYRGSIADVNVIVNMINGIAN